MEGGCHASHAPRASGDGAAQPVPLARRVAMARLARERSGQDLKVTRGVGHGSRRGARVGHVDREESARRCMGGAVEGARAALQERAAQGTACVPCPSASCSTLLVGHHEVLMRGRHGAQRGGRFGDRPGRARARRTPGDPCFRGGRAPGSKRRDRARRRPELVRVGRRCGRRSARRIGRGGICAGLVLREADARLRQGDVRASAGHSCVEEEPRDEHDREQQRCDQLLAGDGLRRLSVTFHWRAHPRIMPGFSLLAARYRVPSCPSTAPPRRAS